MPHLFDLRGESREKVKGRHTLNEYSYKVSKYGSGDTDEKS